MLMTLMTTLCRISFPNDLDFIPIVVLAESKKRDNGQSVPLHKTPIDSYAHRSSPWEWHPVYCAGGSPVGVEVRDT